MYSGKTCLNVNVEKRLVIKSIFHFSIHIIHLQSCLCFISVVLDKLCQILLIFSVHIFFVFQTSIHLNLCFPDISHEVSKTLILFNHSNYWLDKGMSTIQSSRDYTSYLNSDIAENIEMCFVINNSVDLFSHFFYDGNAGGLVIIGR